MAKPLEEKATIADLEKNNDLQIDLSSTVDPIAPKQDGMEPNQIEEKHPDITYPSGWRFLFMTIGIMTSVLVVALDNYIISTAIPRLTTDFESITFTGWYGSSYFLTIMAFQPAHGQLFTLFPIKRMFIYSIVGFEIGSIITAAAPNPIAFIAGRLVCGAASGGIWCGTLTVIPYAVPPKKRYMYVSIVTSMYGVSSAAGPLLGGVFTDSSLTWRFCFWINLPIGAVALLLIALWLEAPPLTELGRTLTTKDKIRRIDLLGTLLLLTAFTSFFLAAQWGGTTFAWTNSKVWGCILGFVLQIAAFAYLQVFLGDRATIPMRILRNNTAILGLAFQLFAAMVIAIQIYYLPFYFQSVLGRSATSSGILTLPFVMTLLLSPMIVGVMMTVYGHHITVMCVGASMATAGSVLLSTLDVNSSFSQYIGYQFLAALGVGIVQQIPFTSVPLALPPSDSATASALVSFCNSLGPVIILTLGNVLFVNKLRQEVAQIPGLDSNELKFNLVGMADLEKEVGLILLHSVRRAIGFALSRTLVLGIPCSILALCCGIGIQCIAWRPTSIPSALSPDQRTGD